MVQVILVLSESVKASLRFHILDYFLLRFQLDWFRPFDFLSNRQVNFKLGLYEIGSHFWYNFIQNVLKLKGIDTQNNHGAFLSFLPTCNFENVCHCEKRMSF